MFPRFQDQEGLPVMKNLKISVCRIRRHRNFRCTDVKKIQIIIKCKANNKVREVCYRRPWEPISKQPLVAEKEIKTRTDVLQGKTEK